MTIVEITKADTSKKIYNCNAPPEFEHGCIILTGIISDKMPQNVTGHALMIPLIHTHEILIMDKA